MNPGKEHRRFIGEDIIAVSDEALKEVKQDQEANLFVNNLDPTIDGTDLRRAFSKYGTITSTVIVIPDGHSECYGFVCFSSRAEATKAIAGMNGRYISSHKLNDKPLYVAFASRKGDQGMASGHKGQPAHTGREFNGTTQCGIQTQEPGTATVFCRDKRVGTQNVQENSKTRKRPRKKTSVADNNSGSTRILRSSCRRSGTSNATPVQPATHIQEPSTTETGPKHPETEEFTFIDASELQQFVHYFEQMAAATNLEMPASPHFRVTTLPIDQLNDSHGPEPPSENITATSQKGQRVDVSKSTSVRHVANIKAAEFPHEAPIISTSTMHVKQVEEQANVSSAPPQESLSLGISTATPVQQIQTSVNPNVVVEAYPTDGRIVSNSKSSPVQQAVHMEETMVHGTATSKFEQEDPRIAASPQHSSGFGTQPVFCVHGQPYSAETVVPLQDNVKFGIINATPTLPIPQYCNVHVPLTAAMLATASPEDQRQMIGGRLFELVLEMYEYVSNEITDILLDMETSELLTMLENRDYLHTKVVEVVAKMQQSQPNNEPAEM